MFGAIFIQGVLACHAILRFQAAGRIIYTGMNNLAVSRTRPRTDHIFGFQNDDFAARHCQRTRCCQSHDSGAYNDAVYFLNHLKCLACSWENAGGITRTLRGTVATRASRSNSHDYNNGRLMKDNTIVTHSGNHPYDNHGNVNPPVYHASTVLTRTYEDFLDRTDAKVRYGRRGTPTTFALEEAMTALERAYGTVLAPSGLAAITMTLSALTETGDHILITDSAYAPTRNFSNKILKKFGIEAEYYDPTIGAGIADLIRDNTKIIWTESPGSQTFDVQDTPAIVAAAHARDVLVVMDNTWGRRIFLQTAGPWR